VLAEWLVRIGASLILDPLPDADLEPFLAELLVPALKKERAGASRAAR
jgi:hypothetical protein